MAIPIKELKAQINDLDKEIRAEAEGLGRNLENEARIAGATSTRRAPISTLSRSRRPRPTSRTSSSALSTARPRRSATCSSPISPNIARRQRGTPSAARPGCQDHLGGDRIEHAVFPEEAADRRGGDPDHVPAELRPGDDGSAAARKLHSADRAPVERSEPRVDLAARAPAALAISPESERPAPVAETVVAPSEPSGGRHDTVEEVAQRLRANASLGRGIAVVAATPGAPTMASAVSLARALAADAKVVPVSLVPGQPASDAMGLAADTAGISEVVRGASSFGQVIRRDKASRAHFVAAGWPQLEIDTILNSRRFQTMIGALAKAYDHVIVNAGDLHTDSIRLASIAPRGVVVAAPDAEQAVASARRTMSAAGFTDVATMAPAAAGSGQPHDPQRPDLAAA